MAAIIKQTIRQKKISFPKLLAMVFGITLIMNISVQLFARISPMIATIGGLLTLALAIGGCTWIIYRHIAYFQYKIIDDELMMERVFSRANHLFLSLKVQELQRFTPYTQWEGNIKDARVKLYKFVVGKNKDNWYIGEFSRSGDRYRFIIEPNEELLGAIQSAYVEQ